MNFYNHVQKERIEYVLRVQSLRILNLSPFSFTTQRESSKEGRMCCLRHLSSLLVSTLQIKPCFMSKVHIRQNHQILCHEDQVDMNISRYKKKVRFFIRFSFLLIDLVTIRNFHLDSKNRSIFEPFKLKQPGKYFFSTPCPLYQDRFCSCWPKRIGLISTMQIRRLTLFKKVFYCFL